MIGVRINLQSLEATSDRINKVLDQVERRGMKDALLKAATPMVKKTKQLAPRRTGALRRSIGKKGTTDPRTQSARVRIGPRRNRRTGMPATRYAHLVEFGHMAVDGSFVPPYPFMRPAFESTKRESRGLYAKTIGADIHRRFRRAKAAGRV